MKLLNRYIFIDYKILTFFLFNTILSMTKGEFHKRGVIKMTEREEILAKKLSRGLLPGGAPAVYASIQKLRKLLKEKGEDVDYETASILWANWVGNPILDYLEYNRNAIALLGEERFNLFYQLMYEAEDNRFVFSEENAIELTKKAQLRNLEKNYIA